MFDFKNIHIGSVINELVKVRNISEERINNFFGIPVDLESIYNSKSIDSDNLLKWCKITNYDLFRLYTSHLMLYSPISKCEEKDVNNDLLPTFKKNIYTKEIIDFIVGLVNSGEKNTNQIIKEYNIPKTTLFRWIKKYSNETKLY